MTDETSFPRYPGITVPLSGEDGNALAIVGRTSRALRTARHEVDDLCGHFDGYECRQPERFQVHDPEYLLGHPFEPGGLGRLVSDEEVAAFVEEAMSGDYDHVLQTVMRWVNVT